jgi:oligoendopeptidase F
VLRVGRQTGARDLDGIGRLTCAARKRYLDLLGSGGSDHPMTLLKTAGVDLSGPSTVRAVVDQLGDLVGRLEKLI